MLQERNEAEIKVFYTWSQTETGAKYDPGFGKEIKWDVPLLEGYAYTFVQNISTTPGSHHFNGIDNPALIKEIEHWKPDALLVYGWSFKSHLKALRYFHKRIPVFFRGDSTLLDNISKIKSTVRKVWLHYVYNKVDIALYAGAANKAYFLSHGLKEKQLIFMPHAIDNDAFAVTEKSTAEGSDIRRKLGISPESIVFLFAGKLEEKKQPGMLAEAFFKAAAVNTHLIIAGNGAIEQKLKAQYAAHPQMHFMDFQNQSAMPGLYAACNVFVLPSKGPGETWGLAINEAMAAGKPVITTDACGAAFDLITDNVTGFVIGRHDEKALQEKLMFFSQNKNAAAEMGKAALKKAAAYNFKEDCAAIETAMKTI